MARHYSKAELLRMMASIKKEKDISMSRDILVYATYTNLVCHFLYKTYDWSAMQIVDYCNKQKSYYTKYENDNNQWTEQRDRLESYMGDKMWDWYDDTVFTEPANISSNKVINMLNMKMTDINNDYMQETERYFLSHYNAMIDLGLDPDELYKHYELLDAIRIKYAQGSSHVIYKMHQELLDELGVDIQLPSVEDMRQSVVS